MDIFQRNLKENPTNPVLFHKVQNDTALKQKSHTSVFDFEKQTVFRLLNDTDLFQFYQ